VRLVVLGHFGAVLVDHGRVVIVGGGGGFSLVHDLANPGAALRIPFRHGLPVDVGVRTRFAVGLVFVVQALELGIVSRRRDGRVSLKGSRR
jgi:hypothetical protein